MATTTLSKSALLSNVAKGDILGLDGDFTFTINDLLANDANSVKASSFYFGTAADANNQAAYMDAHGIHDDGNGNYSLMTNAVDFQYTVRAGTNGTFSTADVDVQGHPVGPNIIWVNDHNNGPGIPGLASGTSGADVFVFDLSQPFSILYTGFNVDNFEVGKDTMAFVNVPDGGVIHQQCMHDGLLSMFGLGDPITTEIVTARAVEYANALNNTTVHDPANATQFTSEHVRTDPNYTNIYPELTLWGVQSTDFTASVSHDNTVTLTGGTEYTLPQHDWIV